MESSIFILSRRTISLEYVKELCTGSFRSDGRWFLQRVSNKRGDGRGFYI